MKKLRDKSSSRWKGKGTPAYYVVAAALCAFMALTPHFSGCSNGGKTTGGEAKAPAADTTAAVESQSIENVANSADAADAALTEPSEEAELPEDKHESGDLRVFFVYPAPIGDAGWTYAHDLARRELEKMPGVSTGFLESVLGAKYTKSTLESIAKNNDLVFTTSYEFMDPTIVTAERFPEVIFMHCSGYKRRENVGTYFGRMYMARYLTGMVAGGMSKKGEIGYVAAFPIPEVIRGINAFTLGAKSVNPDVRVHVIWTETWFNPTLERDSALKLVEMGVDVLAQHQNSPECQKVAEEKGIYSVGYNHDMSSFAPNAHLTAAVWNWNALYQEIVKEVKEGTWGSRDMWWGLKEGLVDISPFGLMVPKELVNKTMGMKEKIANGSHRIFRGPITDSTKTVRIGAGKVPTDQDLLTMDWYVEGVENHWK